LAVLIFSISCTSSKPEPTNYEARKQLLDLIAGEWIAKSIYAATELDIATILAKGPMSIHELAIIAECNEEHLYRLLHMLSSNGIFSENDNCVFSNTEVSHLLSKEYPFSLHDLVHFYGQEMSQSWNLTTECIKQGRPAFDLTFEMPVFAYFKSHPEAAQIFNAAMKEKSKMVIDSLLHSYDFGRFRSICDIGGGCGHFLSAIFVKYPNMKGILFELSDVIASSDDVLRPFEKRCSRIAGNFFQNIPVQADAYLLKSVLHDWNDQDAIKILKNCHQAMPDGSSLLIVEPIVSDSNKKEMAKVMDVYMMIITGGKERTRQEFEHLLEKSGFRLDAIISTETEFSFMIASKR